MGALVDTGLTNLSAFVEGTVIPKLLDLSNWFSETMIGAIDAVKEAVDGQVEKFERTWQGG